jgi:hypothetical protein
LYIEYLVALLIILLIEIQWFNGVLLSAPVIATLMSLVVVVVIINLM